MGTKWRHLLTVIDSPTGDGRRFAPGSITHRELPLALKWRRADEPGHDSSVPVGSIDSIDVGDTEVWGEGEWFDDIDTEKMPRLAEDVAEAMHLYDKGVVGPSVDAGSADAVEVDAATGEPLTQEQWIAAMEAGEEPVTEIMFTRYEIAAATLVPIPAYAETAEAAANDTPTEEPDEPAEDAVLVAAVTGSTDLPVAARDTQWDGGAAAQRVFDQFTDGDTMDVDAVSRAFLWRDPDADPQLHGSYKLGFADWIDGALRIVPHGVAATAGGRGVDATKGISATDKAAIKRRICSLYGEIQDEFEDWPDCPFEDAMTSTAKYSLVAAALPVDASVFDDPQLSELTPFTYDPQTRRVFGHAAYFGSCHVGYKDLCVAPPESVTDYALFHRYPVNTTAGETNVGRITTGHGTLGNGCQHSECTRMDDHACMNMTMDEAKAHHNQMRTLAHVKVGIDETNNAIWFAGIAEPGLSEDDVKVMSRRKVSGDWRQYGANLELTEILALASEEPGFPLPHTSIRDGNRYALIAAAPVRPVVAAGVSRDELAEIAGQLSDIAARLASAEPDDDETDTPDNEPDTDSPDMASVVADLRSTINNARGQMATAQAETLIRKATTNVLR